MASRYCDTKIWDEDWYCSLSGEYQLFWKYLTDDCDNAGVWKPNKVGFERSTGFKINLDSLFKKVNEDRERIIKLKNGRWFLPGFIKFQWFNKKETFALDEKNKLHKSLIHILIANEIEISKVRGLREVLNTSMDKDKEKESLNTSRKEIEEPTEEGTGETNLPEKSPDGVICDPDTVTRWTLEHEPTMRKLALICRVHEDAAKKFVKKWLDDWKFSGKITRYPLGTLKDIMRKDLQKHKQENPALYKLTDSEPQTTSKKWKTR